MWWLAVGGWLQVGELSVAAAIVQAPLSKPKVRLGPALDTNDEVRASMQPGHRLGLTRYTAPPTSLRHLPAPPRG